MIIDFTFSNFRSWKDEAEFTMVPGSSRKRKKSLLHPRKDCTLLPITAIYGPNASGKSNFVYALLVLQGMVKTGIPVYDCYRLAPEMQKEPSKFCITFLAPVHRSVGGEGTKELVKFRYSLHVASSDGKTYAAFEELINLDIHEAYEASGDKETFRKQHDAEVGRNEKYDGTIFRKTCKTTDTPAVTFESYLTTMKFEDLYMVGIFLSMGGSMRVAYLTDVVNWFTKSLRIATPSVQSWNLMDIFQRDPEQCNAILQQVQTGIDELKVRSTVIDEQQTDQNLINMIRNIPVNEIFFNGKKYVKENGNIVEYSFCPRHRAEDGSMVELPLNAESEGTQRFINLMGIVASEAEVPANIYVIDELERSLHPELFRYIIERHLQRAEQATEQTPAQLIFTTHNALLLKDGLMRVDELWGVEKRGSASTLFSFAEYDEAFADKNLMRSYLRGYLGAVPNF